MKRKKEEDVNKMRQRNKKTLLAAGEQIRMNTLTRRQMVGYEGTGSSRSTPLKGIAPDDMNVWNKTVVKELEYKRISREKKLDLRAPEIELMRERWAEEKEDRKHNKKWLLSSCHWSKNHWRFSFHWQNRRKSSRKQYNYGELIMIGETIQLFVHLGNGWL